MPGEGGPSVHPDHGNSANNGANDMTDNTYNGWTNYATWRVNLEMFDAYPTECVDVDDDAYDVGLSCKDWAEELICETAGEGLARDYALAFLSDVNWTEIARHMIDNAKEEA